MYRLKLELYARRVAMPPTVEAVLVLAMPSPGEKERRRRWW